MESTGLLETIAQVSATFAGFSGIVSVFGKWTVEPSERLWRIRIMILTSLLTMMIALIPGMLQLFNFPVEVLWRVGCALLGIGTAAHLYAVFRWMPEPYRHGFFSKPLPAALTVASLVFVVVELTVSIGVATGYASALYVCGLLYLLFLSAYHFVRVILSAQPA